MTQGKPRDAAAERIMKGAAATLGGFAIRFGARVMLLLVAGHLFGAVLFGAFALGAGVVATSVGFAGLSLKKMLFPMLEEGRREGAEGTTRSILDAVLLVAAASALVAVPIMAAAALLPRSVLAEATAAALFWLAPAIAGQALLDVLTTATRWTHKVRYEVVARSIVEPYGALAGAVAAYLIGFRETGLLIGYWAGTLAALAYAAGGLVRCFELQPSGYRFSATRLRDRLRLLLPNTWTDVLIGIYDRIDLFLVGILLGERWAGIYGMAHQIRTPIRHIRQSFDTLLVPLVTRTLEVRGSDATGLALANACRFLLVVQLPVLIAFVAIGMPLMELFGVGFGAGYLTLVLLAAADIMQVTFGLGDLLFVYLRPRLGFLTTLGSILAGTLAALFLIPEFGITGAALSVLLTFAFQALVRRLVLRTQLGLTTPLYHSGWPLIAGAAGIALVVLTASETGTRFEPGLILPLAVGLGAYAAILFAWLKLSGEDISIRGFHAGENG
jgi:O-antigen/teichoic acid export membrane protein